MIDKQNLISVQKGCPYHPFAESSPFNSFILMEKIPDEEKLNKPAGININTIPFQPADDQHHPFN